MNRSFGIGGLALLLTAASAPAIAADCAPRDLVTAIDMTQQGGRMLVSVGINGTDKNLLLDTAAGLSTLNPQTIQALKLPTTESEGVRLLDSQGNSSHMVLTVGTFRVGDLLIKNQILAVTPDPSTAFDGSLAVDLLEKYDVEMDFSEQQMKFFTPSACAAGTIPWKADQAAQIPIVVQDRNTQRSSYAPVVATTLAAAPSRRGTPFGTSNVSNMDQAYNPDIGSGMAGLYLKIPVTIDGKDFSAVIDSGAPISTMSAATAKAVYGVTAASPGSGPVHLITPDGVTGVSESVTVTGTQIFEHVFHTMSFGGVTVIDPHFTVRPEKTGSNDRDNAFQTGGHLYRVDDGLAPDITIGMDVLKKLHLFFAFQNRMLYVTAAK